MLLRVVHSIKCEEEMFKSLKNVMDSGINVNSVLKNHVYKCSGT